VTCTDQPGDQIIGVISAGVDGRPGTDDDFASWQLGRSVTDIARGARWVAAVAPGTPATPATPDSKPSAEAKQEPGAIVTRPRPVGTKQAGTRPPEGAKPKPAQRGKVLELDKKGLPINR
jgi:hypothetical protein